MNKWSRPFEGNRAAAAPAGADNSPEAPHRYFAFLSYAHTDSADADWLHQELERFRVPSSLAGRLTANGIVPKRLTPVFRDQHELAASEDLGAEIRQALANSRCLIVLCSPAAAKSKWTNAEIATFKRVHPEGCIVAAVIGGEPLASDIPGREDEECFPPALVAKYNRRGKPTGQKTEPLAADLREGRGSRRMGFLKVVAGILGVGLDELVQREQLRRQRRLAYIAAASLVGMVVTSTLAVTALDARNDARDQRQAAESLVGFMLGDLREKLEPIGRLDALDAVGSRALEYYERQDKSDLSDEALAQRSRALTLMGEIADTRGDLNTALRLYREAFATTAEAVRRYPDEPQRLFDHAQNVFYVGHISYQRGALNDAEVAWREYKRLADRMAAFEPGNAKWQMEVKYANTNLGVLLFKQRRFAEAEPYFRQALLTVEAIAAADPADSASQKSVPTTLAWLADTEFELGRIDQAIAKRERQASLAERLARTTNDVEYRDLAITAHRALGRWLAARGETAQALVHARTAVASADELIPTEPQNMLWVEAAAGAKLDLAGILLAIGNTQGAAVEGRAGCDMVDRLVASDSKVLEWQSLATQCLARRAEIAARSGSAAEAEMLARRVLAATRARAQRPGVHDFATPNAYKLLGDVLSMKGDRTAATQAHQAALAAWPQPSREGPSEIALKAQLLSSLGREGEAQALKGRLERIGYRRFV